eukprot:5251588-Lingulodinium_polyedra.AAC.1
MLVGELARVKLGVTDSWVPRMQAEVSSSGAKFYVQTKPGWRAPVVRVVCSVMEEVDIEIPSVGSSAPQA